MKQLVGYAKYVSQTGILYSAKSEFLWIMYHEHLYCFLHSYWCHAKRSKNWLKATWNINIIKVKISLNTCTHTKIAAILL